ncbi:sialate O-acetylesterase [Dysgonomonas hofstadii]|nr:sialate O-acetylesterase [Dysgonomonas hofstadii]
MKKLFVLFIASLFQIAGITAQVKLSPLFSDNMILQRETNAPIWGKSDPNKNIEITTSWNNKKYTVSADAQGNWKISVETPAAGGPYTITISDGKPVKLNNVLIGEVWICSGQSNMEMQVEGWGKVTNYQQELVEAQNYPNIRLLQVERATSPQPLEDIKVAGNGWQVCSSKTVADFSAVGYFFGRDIHKYQNVPVGLINTSWGGTIIETWTSGEALATMPDYKEEIASIKKIPQSPEEREELFYENVELWKKDIEKIDKGFNNGQAVWASIQNDDSGWEQMNIPSIMQEQGLKGFNGIVWFRKTIDIPAKWEGKELTLNLGPIDDNDFTYFNGIQVGHTEGWMAQRSYKIPKELVTKGKAIISVRVMDTGGNGGIFGSPESINLQIADNDRLALAGPWKYKVSLNIKEIPRMPVNMTTEPNIPSFLFNAMLNPLIPYSIKGAIWYQGEGNTGQAYQYRELMPLMITDWRNRWGYDFPFYMVQLAAFTALQTEPVNSTWAELREAQTLTAQHLKNTGMAVTIDIGDAYDIHPKNKLDVGKRLALQARAKTYGEKIPHSGLMYHFYQIEDNKIRIFFRNSDGGLKAKDGEQLKGFTIAGTDHKFYWADAVIEGNTIVVSSPDVKLPLAVRYAWADNPICNLYNGAGLPASPFRTDDWQGITYGQKR